MRLEVLCKHVHEVIATLNFPATVLSFMVTDTADRKDVIWISVTKELWTRTTPAVYLAQACTLLAQCRKVYSHLNVVIRLEHAKKRRLL
jgi:hypothetical protein